MAQEFSLSNFIKRVTEVVSQPELHMREIPILVGLAILLVFIVLIIIALIFVRPSDKRPYRVEEKELRASIRRRYVALIILGVLIITSVSFLVSYTSKPWLCGSCHEMRTPYKNSERTVHRELSCLSCHQEPGATGFLVEKLKLIEMVMAKTKVIGEVAYEQVGNKACLNCHEDVVKEVKTNGTIRIKHKEPLEANYRCTDCHFSSKLIHSKVRKLEKFGMSNCVDCHDQKQASADCGVCHTRGNKISANIDRESYPKASITKSIACKKCHAGAFCLRCHSIAVPHANDWMSGGHALDAFSKKKLCWQCHVKSTCKKCHTNGLPHGDNWATEHGEESKTRSELCSNCHNTDFCLKCHQDISDYKLKTEIEKSKTSL